MNQPRTDSIPNQPDLSRRSFLQRSSLAAVAGSVAAMSFPSVLSAQSKQTINAALIGLGGRGGGAGENFLEAAKLAGVDGNIVAVADVFPDAAKNGAKTFKVAEDKCFSGFDAYMKAINVP